MPIGMLRLTYLFLLVLIACNGDPPTGDENSRRPEKPYAPENIVNIGFDLTITEHYTKLLGKNIPQYDSQLQLSFAKEKIIFFRSDIYDEWEYQSRYQYKKLANNEADIEIIDLDAETTITISLTFRARNQGVFTVRDNAFNEILTGNFYFSTIEPPENYLYSGNVIKKKTISSSYTGVTYPYRVYLPASYQQSTQYYPIIYATDGQWVFWDFSKYLDQSNTQAILVAIEQGPNNQRLTDYRLPDSKKYLDFFKREFIPLIESEYRAINSERTIQGASFGGLLVSHFLLDHDNPPTFQNYISSDGSYWFNQSLYIEQEKQQVPGWIHNSANLYLSGASGKEGNASSVKYYRQRLMDYQLSELTINYKEYSLDHNQITLPAFKTAIADIFNHSE